MAGDLQSKAGSVVLAPTGMRSIVGVGDHYGAESMLSGVSTGINTQLLPQLSKNVSKDNQSAAAAPIDGKLKRANAEALQLLIQNKNKK